MVKSIVVVAAILLGLMYSALFLMWNASEKANVVVWNLPAPPVWLEDVPVGILPLIGALIGAAVMAIAAWLPWAALRAASRDAEAKLKKALDRYNQQKQVVADLKTQIAELQSQLEGLAAPTAENTPQAVSAAGPALESLTPDLGPARAPEGV